MYCFWYFPVRKGSGEAEGTAVTLSVCTNTLYWFYTLINELYVNVLLCTYVFLPGFITAEETGASAPSLWGLLLGEHCSCPGLCCEEDTRPLQTKAMLCLSCVSFIKRTKAATIYQAASHPWFRNLQYVCQQAEPRRPVQGHRCRPARVPAMSSSFRWVAQSYFFNSISIYPK